MIEEWKPIPGHEGRYEVSNLGRFKSLPRVIVQTSRWGTPMRRQWKGGIIHPDPHHTGYLVIKLGDAKKQYRAHVLVALAWLGPCPPGMIVSHSDDNKVNIRADNLEYMTNPDNVKRAYRTGRLSNKGETNGKAVLTDEIVAKILALPRSMLATEAAIVIGCKKHSIHQVRRGAWGHVPRPSETA